MNAEDQYPRNHESAHALGIPGEVKAEEIEADDRDVKLSAGEGSHDTERVRVCDGDDEPNNVEKKKPRQWRIICRQWLAVEEVRKDHASPETDNEDVRSDVNNGVVVGHQFGKALDPHIENEEMNGPGQGREE